MTESLLDRQLTELRILAQRARNLFGHKLIEPPALNVRPDPVIE